MRSFMAQGKDCSVKENSAQARWHDGLWYPQPMPKPWVLDRVGRSLVMFEACGGLISVSVEDHPDRTWRILA